MSAVPQNGITDIIIVRYLNVIKQDDIFQLRGVAHHAVVAHQRAAPDKGALAQYDEQLAEYYLTRGSNNRRDTWSDHIRRTIIKESRPFILDYLHKQGWATR